MYSSNSKLSPISSRLLIYTLFVLNAWLLSAQEYIEVILEGSVSEHHPAELPGQQETETTRTFPIKCVFGPSTWSIESGFIKNATEMYFFDGTNVYTRRIITGEHPDKVAVKIKLRELSPEETKDISYLFIKPGSHPLGTLGVNVAWLAYCSSSYLKTADKGIPVPGYDPTVHIGTFGFTNHITNFEDPLALPKSVEFIAANNIYQKSLWDERQFQSERLSRERKNPRLPFPDGTIIARYLVNSATNYLGWNIPTSFRYQHYGPSRSKPGQLDLLFTVSGQVTSLQQGKAPTNVFVQGKRQIVSDFRFHNEQNMMNFLHYEWTNGFIPAVTSPIAQAALVSQTERGLRGKTVTNARSTTLLRWCLLLGAILVSACFVFFSIQTNNKTKNTINEN